MTLNQTRTRWILELMPGHPIRCFNMFRMDESALVKLVSELQLKYGLKTTRRISALEMVCIFVHIVGQGCSNRLAQERLQHSIETVSRVFTEFLESVCRMAFDVLKAPCHAPNRESKPPRSDACYTPSVKSFDHFIHTPEVLSIYINLQIKVIYVSKIINHEIKTNS
ncbi:hypothetical protein CFOL_v3_12757 [Cephalotus follicularis]|uniref:DUF8040 domain-containing protein n=1 Tax=Cephalotus follicularis TaxID=3775 RepID=A0A1Q3BMJ6_CEPFO|nr:hypothetical protein CFOL_v3_12757 [Cephalotus follicularis]